MSILSLSTDTSRELNQALRLRLLHLLHDILAGWNRLTLRERAHWEFQMMLGHLNMLIELNPLLMSLFSWYSRNLLRIRAHREVFLLGWNRVDVDFKINRSLLKWSNKRRY